MPAEELATRGPSADGSCPAARSTGDQKAISRPGAALAPGGKTIVRAGLLLASVLAPFRLLAAAPEVPPGAPAGVLPPLATAPRIDNAAGNAGNNTAKELANTAGNASSIIAPNSSEAAVSSAYTLQERTLIHQFWNQPGRYQVSPIMGESRWQVRLTPQASSWFLRYQAAVGSHGVPPTVDAAGSGSTSVWETWTRAKLSRDRAAALLIAEQANRGPNSTAPLPSPVPDAAAPGPISDELLAATGNPPPFAAAVVPFSYHVAFEDGDGYDYQDQVLVRPRFAYFRFPQGVMDEGTRLKAMPTAEIDSLFRAAGLTPSEERIFRAVSLQEGGFDAVNTYDTGYVSIGFIQFITGRDGKGSLTAVLAREKNSYPLDFDRDFRQYGVTIRSDGQLATVDPSTGAELTGEDAVMSIINDKRLTAVFQRAGRRSRSFRLAQLVQAWVTYWPANDPVVVSMAGQTLTGKVSDIIHSEAGMATLFDRKVNRGSLNPLADVIAAIMREHGLTTLQELPAWEAEILASMKYRGAYLKDPTLSQPPPSPVAGAPGAVSGSPAVPAPGRGAVPAAPPAPVSPTTPTPPLASRRSN